MVSRRSETSVDEEETDADQVGEGKRQRSSCFEARAELR